MVENNPKGMTLEVRAINTIDAPLRYWLPTPCHSPFRVEVVSASGERAPIEADQPGTFCIQVIRPLVLDPRKPLSQLLTLPVPPGAASLRVRFVPPSMEYAPHASIEAALPAALSDITGHWAAADIARAVEAGFVQGYPDRSFLPDNQGTRAEFIKMLVMARKLQPATAAAPAFDDVAEHWVDVQGYLQAAVNAGYVDPADWGGSLAPDVALPGRRSPVWLCGPWGSKRQSLPRRPLPTVMR